MIRSNPVVVSSPVGRLRRQVAIGVWAVMVGCSGASRPPNLNDSHLFKDAGGSGTGGGSGMGGSPDADGTPDPNDPFGSCVLGVSILPSWSLVCSNGRSLCVGGGEGPECDANACPGVFHVMCAHDCAADSDCPIPSTGTSRPICQLPSHWCLLPCASDVDCPISLTCQDGTPWLPFDGVTGNSFALPHMCMQTITVDVPDLDGGQ